MYEGLRGTGFAIQGPRYEAFAQNSQECDDTVVAAKVTIAYGGLILCLSAHHSFVNAAGLGILAKLYAECCAGKDITNHEQIMNQDRV
jgi:hypothetical protein